MSAAGPCFNTPSGPNSSVTCYLLTYNLAGKALLMTHLRTIATEAASNLRTDVIDILAFGFQECPKKWNCKMRTLFRRQLNRRLAQCLTAYKIVKVKSFGVLHLVVFGREELVRTVTDIETIAISLSRMSQGFRTKGAVAVAFRLNGRSFLFVNCHFRFGGSLEIRRCDYHRVVSALSFSRFASHAESTSTVDKLTPFDCVFMLGDFNSRFAFSAHSARRILGHRRAASLTDIRSATVRRLEKFDQLYLEMQKTERKSFEKFNEDPIRFPPTYKFVINTCRYNWRRRVPAYTDRVLYRISSSTSVRCTAYNSIRSIRISDHLPVFAVFQVTSQ